MLTKVLIAVSLLNAFCLIILLPRAASWVGKACDRGEPHGVKLFAALSLIVTVFGSLGLAVAAGWLLAAVTL